MRPFMLTLMLITGLGAMEGQLQLAQSYTKESGGDIAGALDRAARRYDRELTSRIGHLTTLIQPAVIFLVALFVGIVAYSMIAGILTSVSSLRSR